MTADNGHCCFQLLAQELTRLGLPEEAEKVLSAIASGSTGSECLGLVGQAILQLRRRHPKLATGPLAQFIAPCISAIKQAWPRYK